jgi:subtilisin family serine protease
VTKRKRTTPKVNQAARTPPSERRSPPSPAATQLPSSFPGRMVVLVSQDQPPDVEAALAQENGISLLGSATVGILEGRVASYLVPPTQSISQLIAKLNSDDRVRAAQRSILYTTNQEPKAGGAPLQYALEKLRLDRAHQIAQGREVRIAVIDTAVDTSHPTLEKATVQTFDAVNEGDVLADDHGTAVAALIAGRGRVSGVAPAANVLAIRAFYVHQQYKRAVTSSEILVRALDWAYANKARIFNMSFAGAFDRLLQAALSAASRKGVIHVAAAGNGGPEAPAAYPAAYDNVIAITALDQKDRLYRHANQGPYLTAAAPGVDVLVPTLKRGYRYSSGTSLAAAYVSGLVALLLERNPEASADDIIKAIGKSAHDLGPKGYDAKFGYGRADAYASLLTIQP